MSSNKNVENTQNTFGNILHGCKESFETFIYNSFEKKN